MEKQEAGKRILAVAKNVVERNGIESEYSAVIVFKLVTSQCFDYGNGTAIEWNGMFFKDGKLIVGAEGSGGIDTRYFEGSFEEAVRQWLDDRYSSIELMDM